MLNFDVCSETHRVSLFQPYQKPAREPEDTKKIYDSTEKLDKFEEAKKSISKGYYWLFAMLISLVVGMQITNESNISFIFKLTWSGTTGLVKKLVHIAWRCFPPPPPSAVS